MIEKEKTYTSTNIYCKETNTINISISNTIIVILITPTLILPHQSPASSTLSSLLLLSPLSPSEFYQRILALKREAPNVRVMLALGGWVDSTGDKYSRLVNNPKARAK